MADTSSTSAGKLTIGVEVNSSTVAADVAAVKAKAEQAANGASDTVRTGGLLGMAKDAGKAAQAVGNLITKLVAVGGTVALFYSLGAAIRTYVIDLLSTGAEKADRFKASLDLSDVKGSITSLGAELQILNARIEASQNTILGSVLNSITGDTLSSLMGEAAAIQKTLTAQIQTDAARTRSIKREDAEKESAKLVEEAEKKNAAIVQKDAETQSRLAEQTREAFASTQSREVQIVEAANAQIRAINKETADTQSEEVLAQAEQAKLAIRNRAAFELGEHARTLRDKANAERDAFDDAYDDFKENRARMERETRESVRRMQQAGFEASGSTVFGAGAIPDLLRAIQYQGSVRQE